MPRTIKFQRNVARDLESVLDPYDAVSIATSNRVRGSISKILDFIETFPEMYAVAFDDVRIVKITDYPILIQYRVIDGTPIVISVIFSGTPGQNKGKPSG